MKKIINAPENFVPEMLQGLLLAHAGQVDPGCAALVILLKALQA